MGLPVLLHSSFSLARAARARGFAPVPPGGGSANLVAEWNLDEASGTVAVDDQGLSNGAYQGAIEYGVGSIVAGDASNSVAFDGVTGGLRIPHVAGMALASYSLHNYAQADALPAEASHFALFNKGGSGTTPGGVSVEFRNTGGVGKIRAYTRTADGTNVFLGDSQEGFGSIGANDAFSWTLTVGSGGTKLYLDEALVASSTNNAGWSNNTADIFAFIWSTGITPFDGVGKRLLLYSGELNQSEISALANAQNVSRGGDGAITLTEIDAWAVDAASGGTIGSASGGTMPAVTVGVDPTPFVSNAVGAKGDWSAEFRNATLGTWARLSNGNYLYTPGATPGVENAEYRVSDDAGATWSAWTPITIEVVARPPGPFFLVEDYAGTNQQKIQAAIDAANTAGGTVTTLARSTVYDSVFDLNPREAHYLGLKLKKQRSVHGPTGDFAGVNPGPTKCSDADWVAGGSPGYFGQMFARSAAATSKELQFILCDFDGNSQQQALRTTQGDHPTPTSPCGTAWPGTGDTNDFFNLQQQSSIHMRGADASGTENMAKAFIKRCRLSNTCGDAIIASSGWIRVEDCIGTDCARGVITVGTGNTIVEATRVTCLSPTVGGGVDLEAFARGGTRKVTGTFTDCQINDDFDALFVEGSVLTWDNCIIGPGIIWNGGGNSRCSHVGGEVRFHRKGVNGAGNYPSAQIWGDGDDVMTLEFDGVKFVAWGDPYVFHGLTYTPAVGEPFEIEIDLFTAVTKSFTLTLHNCTCTARNLPGSNAVRLFRTRTGALFTAAQSTVTLDGITFSSDYAQDAVIGNGQRLLYRNVVHQGFPTATIQQICPGFGEYIAIQGAVPPVAVNDTGHNVLEGSNTILVPVLANDQNVSPSANPVVTKTGSTSGPVATTVVSNQLQVTSNPSGTGAWSQPYQVTTDFGSATATASGTVTAGAPPPAGELGTAAAIPLTGHPRLFYTMSEILALRSLISGGTQSDLNTAYNAIANTTAQLIPGGWPSTYPAMSTHAQPTNAHNFNACISYLVSPTTTKANAIRTAINDMMTRYPNGRRGDHQFGMWHLSWAWMIDLLRAFHPDHYTTTQWNNVKEWCRKNATLVDATRRLASRSRLLAEPEYQSSTYHISDAGKLTTFYTNWFNRTTGPSGAMALVSGNQAAVDFQFQSWWPNYHHVLNRNQITSTFPPDGLNRYDAGMYVLSIHPHGEVSDTWTREAFSHSDEKFARDNNGKYHGVTTMLTYLCAEMAYRNGMTGIFNLADDFVTKPLLLLSYEFMRDHRDSLDRVTGAADMVHFSNPDAAFAWARYNTTKINELRTRVLSDNRFNPENDISHEFAVIYKYPRRVIDHTSLVKL